MGGKLIQRPQTEEKNMTILRWPFSAGNTYHLGSVLKNPSCLWNTQKAQLGQEPPGARNRYCQFILQCTHCAHQMTNSLCLTKLIKYLLKTSKNKCFTSHGLRWKKKSCVGCSHQNQFYKGTPPDRSCGNIRGKVMTFLPLEQPMVFIGFCTKKFIAHWLAMQCYGNICYILRDYNFC